jgi:hypothetical protein
MPNVNDAVAPYGVTVEERIVNDTRWVALRARGAEWSWLTPKEAAKIGKQWVDKYGARLRMAHRKEPE